MPERTVVFVDADACPVTREAITVARARLTPWSWWERGAEPRPLCGPARRGIAFGRLGPDAADYAIVTRLSPSDVVVTDDLGLVAMAMGEGSRALSFRGRVYLAATIDAELAVRHAEQRHRRAGGRTRGPSPLAEEDKQRFKDELAKMLRERGSQDNGSPRG